MTIVRKDPVAPVACVPRTARAGRPSPPRRRRVSGPLASGGSQAPMDEPRATIWPGSGTRWFMLVAVAWGLGAAAVWAAEPPFELFPVSDVVRVFEDGHACPASTGGEVRLFGLRNEVLSAQGVVRANQDLSGLTIRLDPLERDGGAARIATENIQWNFVTSIFIEENTRKRRAADLVRAAPAWFPDCLAAERQCDVGRGQLRAVYLTLRIPADAAPGKYHGRIVASAADVEAALPIILTVHPLTLPDQRHVMVTEWFSTRQFKLHHGLEDGDTERFETLLRCYAENMAEHRQNVFRVSLGLINSTLAADGELRFDFSEFDRWAQIFWDTARMDLLETGFVAHFGEGGWSSREVLLSGATVTDEATGERKRMSGEEYLPRFLPALVKHLREKQWLDKTVFHVCDEPSNHNVMAWREASDFVHRCAPELRRMDAIETTHCLDSLEVWVPKLDHLATWHEAYEDARRQGNELWFYTVGIFQGSSLMNKTVDVALIESRLLHWLNYRYGLTGYLHWGFNAWTEDPWKAPGKHRGDGWHVYPTRDGLLNSLRWEQMRNGLQDYECLWLLEDRIAQLRATLSPRVAALIEPSRRGVEIASQVVRTFSDYSRDPDVLYAARRQAIDETLRLDVSPLAVVQTNPLEHSVVAGDCGIDIHGWIEPGARVRVNGEETPLATDGLFLASSRPSTEGAITVEIENEKGRMTLVRQFQLEVKP